LTDAAYAVLAALLAAVCLVVAMLPAFPIDETRYLTVAWEMRTTGNWSLPTLNFAPYSHKPPLLFWLINASWSVFGLSVWPARMIGALSMAGALALSHHLEKRLNPEAPRGIALSPLLLLALPLFVTLGFSIMFDMLLTATVTGAMLALWIASRTGARNAFGAYALCVGLGLLAKGPVALVFTVPPAVLARFWIDPAQRPGWAWRIALALAAGIAMALAWALRASYLGGPEFAEMLFWKQSAGRIASSFAHARPFWFYAPILLLLLTPLLLWRPLWSAFRNVLGNQNPARNFLLAWIVPAFVGLSLVSGKQLHYLLPLVPALALLAALGLDKVAARGTDRIPLVALVVLAMTALAVFGTSGMRWLTDDSTLMTMAARLDLPLLALTGALVLIALAGVGRTIRASLCGLAAANLIVLISLAGQSRATLVELFDLQPVASLIAGLGDRAVVSPQDSRGEIGFLARLKQPVVRVPRGRLTCWLLQHPHSVAFVREKDETTLPESDARLRKVLFTKPFRTDETITVYAAVPPATDADRARIAGTCRKPD
jgi:4-amino-4-deoxy-L-arabinose transferase-like glycosyltransferase